jgi:hypothetical protein
LAAVLRVRLEIDLATIGVEVIAVAEACLAFDLADA